MSTSRAFACLVAMALAACMLATDVSPSAGAGPASSSTCSEEVVLDIGCIERMDHPNPCVGMSFVSELFFSLVYDSLFSVDEDLGYVGNLATDWRCVPSTDPEMVASGEPYGSVWEYDITVNARWHDGQLLTVDDVVWTINLNAENYDDMWAYQPYAYFMDYAEATDEDTVRVHYFDRDTGEPVPVAHGDSLLVPILPRHKLEEYTAAYVGFTWVGVFFEDDCPVVGTGPFTATEDIWDEYIGGDPITLVRNPDYHWGPDRGLSVSVDKVVIHSFDDSYALALALREGEVDIARLPPETYIDMELDVAGGTLSDVECYDGLSCTQRFTEIGINAMEAGPNMVRLDPAVRQALALATDKSLVSDVFYGGLAEPGTTIVSPVVEGWHYEPSAEELFAFDLEAASAVLEAAGYRYPDGGGDFRVVTEDSLAYENGWALAGTPLTVEMLVRRTYPEDKDIADHLEEEWAQIGVDLQYSVLDETSIPIIIYGYDFDTVIWSWDTDPDPNHMLFCRSGRSVHGWNELSYDDPSFNEAYMASVGELDDGLRRVHTDECQRIDYLDAFDIVLAYPYQTYAWRTDTFSGWGDWDAHPGMSLDAHWGASPLIFNLSYGDTGALVPYECEDRFSLLVPGGWALEEDAVIADTRFDLVAWGPVHNGFQTNLLVASERTDGVEESEEYLEEQMDSAVEELSEMGTPVSLYGTTEYWECGNCSALRFAIEWQSVPVIQDMTVYADEVNRCLWVVTCSVDAGYYGAYEPLFAEVSQSFDAVDDPAGLSILAYVAIGAAVAGGVAVAVVALLLTRRGKGVPHPGPEAGAAASPVGGVCPTCGSRLPDGGAFCPACGRRMGGP